MARNYQRKHGLVLAMTGIALLAVTTQSMAQPLSNKELVRKFVDATELYKKCEYEKAKVLFDEVNSGFKQLSRPQQKDLSVWIEFNDLALKGRERYGELLKLTRKALDENRRDDAQRHFKELESNPYPSKPQRLEC